MTRRLIALLTIALVALVAGCGGDDGGGGTSVDELLVYLPEDTPFAAVIETDLEREQYENVDRMLGKFPFGGQVKNQLKQSVNESGADFDKDIKPLLGNPVVVGSPDARSLVDGATEDQFVVAWNVKDSDKFRELIEREGDSRESGEIDGEKAYESQDGSVVIFKGDTLIAANDRATLEAAAERAGGDDNLSEDTFNEGLGDLPEDAPIRVFGDAQKLLEADPSTAQARQIKWVGGLRTFGLTATAEGDGVVVDVRVNTEGVGEQDLPLAPGDESPPVARQGEYAIGLRNATQLIRFIENAFATVDQAQFREYDTAKKAAGRDLEIDIDKDLIDQFTGAGSVTGGLDGKVAVRSEVEDPAALETSLDAMVEKGSAGDSTYKEVDGLVEATDEDDGDKTYLGLVDGVFVAGDNPADTKRVAAAQPAPVPGARGAMAAIADGEAIAKAVLARQGGGGALGGQFFTGPIGDLTAWVSASPDGLRANMKLKIE